MSDEKPIKTTVYLNATDYRKLKALARSEGRTAAEMVREAVSVYTLRSSAVRRPASIAAGRSGRGDLSERSEDLLEQLGADQ